MKIRLLKSIFFIALLLISQQLLAQNQKDSLKFNFPDNKVSTEELNRGLNHDIFQHINGKINGVSIVKKGSDPNEYSKIYIRGIQSLFYAQPLFIIDGQISDNLYLSSEQIESIEIIKDASQTAVYGSKGMNGVVIVKTRQTETKKVLNIDFSTSISLNSVSKKMDLLDAEQYRYEMNKYYPSNFSDGKSNTNWQNELFRNSISQNYTINTFGKIKKTYYSFLYNRTNNQGIVNKSDLKQNSIDLKLSQTLLNDKLTINMQIGHYNTKSNSIQYEKNDLINNIFYQTYIQNPTFPIFNEDGVTYNHPNLSFNYRNPIEILNNHINTANTNKYYQLLNINYKILSDLNFELQINNAKEIIETNISKPENNSIYTNNIYYNKGKTSLKSAINFIKKISNNHNFNILLSYNYDYQNNNYNSEFIPTTLNNYDYFVKQLYHSIISKISYEYSNRYKLEFLLNNELSVNKFKLYNYNQNWNKIYHTYYPAINLYWNIHNETFMKNVNKISHLALKSGFGYSGSNKIHDFMMLSNPISFDSLSPEKMKELSLGIDLGLLNNRFTASIVLYTRTTSNSLGIIPLPVPPNNYSSKISNTFSFKNSGIEISINALTISKKHLKWYNTFNYFSNKNELLSAPNELRGESVRYRGSIFYIQMINISEPSHVFYLPNIIYFNSNASPVFIDNNGNPTESYYSAKKEIQGQPMPKYEYTWLSSFDIFSKFNLEFSLQMINGHKIFNFTRLDLTYLNSSHNTIHEYFDNREKNIFPNSISSYYLEDASYLRMKYLSLSYSLNPCINKIKTKLKISFTINNLFTYTNYKGIDPAYNYQGVDNYNVYPLSRNYVLGLNMQF